jgi:dihydropteroate synthase
MGILNVTPDSFSDGGRFLTIDRAVDRALEMEAAGADLIDLGGESTRPPHHEVLPPEEELRRILPVIEKLAGKIKVPISVDTYKSQVADAALHAGAEMVNDISGLRFDPRMAGVVQRHRSAITLMHSRGTPEKLHGWPPVRDICRCVHRGLKASLKKALQAGISPQQVVLDPGLGFGKQTQDNLLLLKKLGTMAAFRTPLLVGASRKSFIGNVLEVPVGERLQGSLACAAAAIFQGVHILRVHDVPESLQVARVCDAILNATSPGGAAQNGPRA